MIGPEILVSREFWGGFVAGGLALAGVLGAIGTWVSDESAKDGGLPSAKVVRGAGASNVYLAAINGNAKARARRKPRKRVKP